MRIVAIGLGGAGCRIVGSLYATDRKSSKVACVQSLAIDVDEQTLRQLDGLPEKDKMFFPAMDLGALENSGEDPRTATIDIKEIIARVQNFEFGETDSIVICCGLGGSMVDVAPHIIAGLRSSTVEPIFGLVTLPCLAEGEKRSGKAADDIDVLSPLLDGIILFDNETWYKKIKAKKATLVKKEAGLAERLGFGKGKQELSPEMATYLLLNEAIVRRISLILRAGEFKADGGIDLAEVVLDSGEVLNTMKGMGFITIGYAVERLPHNPLSFLTRWRPAGIFAEENTKKVSRIVELAKQAIYHEISTPCDMTSAHKALILVAGPSHELSMKGYMTVRKWIDRSIAGLETRSGDYPVMNTKNVAIIIMLAGLENIPRLGEIREIRGQYQTKQRGAVSNSLHQLSDAGRSGAIEEEKYAKTTPLINRGSREIRDEMLVLPFKKHQGGGSSPFSSDSTSFPAEDRVFNKDDRSQHRFPDPAKKTSPQPDESLPVSSPKDIPEKTSRQKPRHRVIVTRDHEGKGGLPSSPAASHSPVAHTSSERKESSPSSGDHSTAEKPRQHAGNGHLRTKDAERLRIERELQRQRMVAISGHKTKTSPGSSPATGSAGSKSGFVRELRSEPLHDKEQDMPVAHQSPRDLPEKRTVIAQRKKSQMPQDAPATSGDRKAEYTYAEEGSGSGSPDKYSADADARDMQIGMRDPVRRAKDDVFDGKEIRKTAAPPARDSSLIHTRQKPRKNAGLSGDDTPDTDAADHGADSSQTPQKPEKKSQKHDDISWI